MITISQFAKETKVSYEAVRKRIERLGDSITPHIFVENGVKVIDDEGVKLLKSGAHKVPVIVYAEEVQNELNEANDTIKALQNDKISLLEEVNEANKRLLELSEQISILKTERAKLEAYNTLLLEDQERSKQTIENITEEKLKNEIEAQRFQEDNARLQNEITDKAAELSRYHKTIFGLYKKDKE